ncbi:hypothetical protein O3M35_012059 [Rhynocoris fuscipes]|uniref:Telomeric repeat-binding factor 2-interacting protein 1 n=1 Tax=Rhynocoris fuscipes TaxID=488301 RepID=A0AAW1CU86_9HEMI
MGDELRSAERFKDNKTVMDYFSLKLNDLNESNSYQENNDKSDKKMNVIQCSSTLKDSDEENSAGKCGECIPVSGVNHKPCCKLKYLTDNDLESCEIYTSSGKFKSTSVKCSLKSEKQNERIRKPYSYIEKLSIIKYIVRNHLYRYLGGNRIWKDMEASNICPNRTWMSLQNHYKKSLINELETFEFLTVGHLKKFRLRID